MIQLGINIDHIATVRNARGTKYPEPITAALVAQNAGADNITAHLREDRRHIKDRDIRVLKEVIEIPLNLEIAATEEMLIFAEEIRPEMCCLVPEKREELTTEGGMDVVRHQQEIRTACQRLADKGIHVSLFIDPDIDQIAAAIACGAPAVELHTGAYAEAQNEQELVKYLEQIRTAVTFANQQGLTVHAGHGLHYHNVIPVAQIKGIEALMIGHAVVAHALFVGMETAVKEMKALLLQARYEGSL